MTAPSPPANLVEGVGADGHNYIVRPMQLTVDNVEDLWDNFARYEIFSDDGPQDFGGFLRFMTSHTVLWFEIVDLDEAAQVGVMYINGLVYSLNKPELLSAQFHAAMWDAKIAPRRDIGKQAIAKIFELFRIHRLETRIPLHHGGAIRTMKKFGFKEDGVMRKAVRYGGEWFGLLVLSLLESEVGDG